MLWKPAAEATNTSNFTDYLGWLERERGLRFTSYEDAWRWSVSETEAFWASIWEFFGIEAATPYTRVLDEVVMPGARWFPGATLNYTQHILRNATPDRPALLFQSETRALEPMSWAELQRQVNAIAAALRALGVTRGDRVAGYLPNIPEAVIALLACATIGAIWSSCSPDFETQGVVERFQQIEPKVLIAVDGYRYAGKEIDRTGTTAELQRQLPSLEQTVLVHGRASGQSGNRADGVHDDARVANTTSWAALLDRFEGHDPVEPEPLPFDHPLWILYSSGTTGLPKAIVQGHGGILLEHMKALALQNDMKPGDRFFWFTTTGWMMWNLLVGGLLIGCTIVLYDGSPAHPDLAVLWRLAEDARITRFGASAAWLTACMKAGLRPVDRYRFEAMRQLGSTGSPLPPEAFRWVYDAVKPDVWLASSSGGTDVCSAFLGACPTLPVHEGELQGRALGASVFAFDDAGQPVHGQVGELVITKPMPSMPLYFWNDPDNTLYRESYFGMYPGVWRHGDWVRFTPTGVIIYGRSDATLNRNGVRIGTSEIYRAVEAVPEVVDSLVIGLERPHGGYFMPLFVVLRNGDRLDDALRGRIRQEIRSRFTARHVPDEIIQVPAVPRTINGKKLEVPIKKILLGADPGRAANTGSLANPGALDFFIEYARQARHV